MKLSLIREQAGTPGWLLTITRLALIFTAVFLSLPASAATTKQKTFTSPEKAVQALVASLKKADKATVTAILGPNSEQLISSGDPVDDRRMRERFLSAYDEKQRLDREGKSKAVLVIGKNDWPFPIPIVMNKNLWRFDSRAGSQEIINRRIGANELDTIQTCLAFIDAQLEYAMDDYDGDGLLEYAAKFWSDPGKKNGLYWQTGEGEAPSPLGELFAKARAEGYCRKEKRRRSFSLSRLPLPHTDRPRETCGGRRLRLHGEWASARRDSADCLSRAVWRFRGHDLHRQS